jgi:hypothetical protein
MMTILTGLDTTGSLLGFLSCRFTGLAAIGASALAWLTRAVSSICTAVADSLVGPRNSLWLILPTRSLFNFVSRRLARLATVGACTFASFARAVACVSSAVADSLIGPGDSFGFILSSLQVCKSSCLIVDISNLLVALDVETSDSLTGRCIQCLLEVGVQSTPTLHSFLCDTI